jgi:hypothetical protein
MFAWVFSVFAVLVGCMVVGIQEVWSATGIVAQSAELTLIFIGLASSSTFVVIFQSC